MVTRQVFPPRKIAIDASGEIVGIGSWHSGAPGRFMQLGSVFGEEVYSVRKRMQ